jgi:hypothetical protein
VHADDIATGTCRRHRVHLEDLYHPAGALLHSRAFAGATQGATAVALLAAPLFTLLVPPQYDCWLLVLLAVAMAVVAVEALLRALTYGQQYTRTLVVMFDLLTIVALISTLLRLYYPDPLWMPLYIPSQRTFPLSRVPSDSVHPTAQLMLVSSTSRMREYMLGTW